MQTLFDNHGRKISYLRLAVTDRCNLRCQYCMPEDGIRYVPRRELLTFVEILRLVRIAVNLGITKVRITGGEPFMRSDLMSLLCELSKIENLEQLHITTNGTLTEPHITELKHIGITSVNLSLDTLQKERYQELTRRDDLNACLGTLQGLIEHKIPVKINAVIMNGKNSDEIHALAELSRHHNIDVRFLEEMPFNGSADQFNPVLNHLDILEALRKIYPDLQKIADSPSSTSYNYKVPGFKGNLGIIASFTRSFCGTCNRIRVTAQGGLKTCLYGDSVLNVKSLLRDGSTDKEIANALIDACGNRHANGIDAEAAAKDRSKLFQSMSVIGG